MNEETQSRHLSPSTPENLEFQDFSFHLLEKDGKFVEERAGILFQFLSEKQRTQDELEYVQIEIENLVEFMKSRFPLSHHETTDYGTRRNDRVSLYNKEALKRSVIQPLQHMLEVQQANLHAKKVGLPPEPIETDSLLARFAKRVKDELTKG